MITTTLKQIQKLTPVQLAKRAKKDITAFLVAYAQLPIRTFVEAQLGKEMPATEVDLNIVDEGEIEATYTNEGKEYKATFVIFWSSSPKIKGWETQNSDKLKTWLFHASTAWIINSNKSLVKAINDIKNSDTNNDVQAPAVSPEEP